jgi:uncharacterized protein YjbI with pentapeptide repeats
MLVERWLDRGSAELRRQTTAWLLYGRPKPDGLGDIDDLIDLRGFIPSDPAAFSSSNVVAASDARGGVLTMNDRLIHGVDLSAARLQNMRTHRVVFENCRFVDTVMSGALIESTRFSQADFTRAKLDNCMLGSTDGDGPSFWEDADFSRADLRRSWTKGSIFANCKFINARMKGFQFDQAAIRDATFAGTLTNVTFDGRPLRSAPKPQPMRNVDFSATKMDGVDFRDCEFENVTLPAGHQILLIKNFPPVIKRAYEIAGELDSPHSYGFQLRWEASVKAPGLPGAVGVEFLGAYADSPELAEFDEFILRQAAAETDAEVIYLP